MLSRIMALLSKLLDPFRVQPRLLLLLVMVCLMMSGNGIVAPVLSIYASTFNAGTTMIGMIITLFGIGRLLANVPAGLLSQRFGRKLLLCLGPGIVAVGSVGAATATSLEALLAWRLIQGIGSGLYLTTSAATLADLSKAGERGRVMALYQAAIGMGAMIGPSIGGFLGHLVGLNAPFWGYAVVALLTLVVALTRAEGPKSKEAKEGRGGMDLRLLLSDPLFALLCVANFGVFFTRTASTWQMIPLLANDSYGLGVESIGLSLTFMTLSSFIMLPFTGPLIDSKGSQAVVVASLAVTALALAIVALSGTEIGFWCGMTVMGLGIGLSGPAIGACSVDLVAAPQYGPAIGLLRTAGDAGFVAGPVIVGLLDDFGSIGYGGGVLANAILVLGLSVAFLWQTRRKGRRA